MLEPKKKYGLQLFCAHAIFFVFSFSFFPATAQEPATDSLASTSKLNIIVIMQTTWAMRM
jgi:hypothetical protein